MSYSANQYNYATPLSSSKLLTFDKVTGKNMIDVSIGPTWKVTPSIDVEIHNANDVTVSVTSPEGGWFAAYWDITNKVKRGTTYTVYFSSKVEAGNAFGLVTVQARKGIDRWYKEGIAYSGESTLFTFTIPSDVEYDVVELRLHANTEEFTGDFYSVRYSNLYLAEEETFTTWEPYTGGASYPVDSKYFVLSDNTLDGSYYPLSGDVGIWGAELPDAEGNLTNPFVVTVNESLSVNAIRLIGSQYCYPVDFTISFYSEDALLSTISETGNSKPEYLKKLSSTLSVDKYVIEVTKVSSANISVRLFNAYNLGYVSRVDTFKVKQNNASELSFLLNFKSYDSLSVAPNERSHILNTIDTTYDTLLARHEEHTTVRNIHSVMKDPFRQVFGKVYITYTDPMLDDETTVLATSASYNSDKEQILDGHIDAAENQFTLYDNNLTGSYVVTDSVSQVGWISSELSNSDGTFDTDPALSVQFASRPVVSLVVTFDDSKDNLVKDFTVTFTLEDGGSVSKTFEDNVQKHVTIVDNTGGNPNAFEAIANVTEITITVHKVTKANSPAVILDIPLSSTILYKGYTDVSDLISIDLLEELTYEDEVEALGGVSANEITVKLDNSHRDFFFNKNTIVSKQLKRNRKIVPWLGAEIVPGQIEWYTLGTFWSYKWDVPVNSLTATVVGFDTLGLLDTTDYSEHHVQIDKSIGQLIEYVLEDAKKSLAFIEYYIDASLYDIIIPYAWFSRTSHTAALRKLSLCYPVHIYCDRNGRICAVPQKLHLDFYYDEWAENTNVMDTSYSSLYTALPNIINVHVLSPMIMTNEQLVQDTTEFDVVTGDVKVLDFYKPYLQDISVAIDCDSSVSYTYSVYSWGISVVFNGTGKVHSITCTGTCVDNSTKSIITDRNETAIKLNGAIVREISSDFIQTASLAKELIRRLKNLSENDKYDASVQYRGDISLTINDPILLKDGIAPDNRYNIKRHELSWNGSLTGSADLNT